MSDRPAPERLPLTSADPLAPRVAELKELWPMAITDGRIDLEKLRALLGEQSASGPERYGLSWAGKSDALKVLRQLTTATLQPAPSESEKWATTGNVIIEGDNLEVLKTLQHAYHGQVKLIYIDPPYNTGGDFIYPDDYAEGLASYQRFTRQVNEEGHKLTTNVNTSGRYHSRWLTMMYPRLYLARNLLREDGVIFVSIDDHEVHNLRLLMDEIFGEENFVAQITVQTNPKGRVLDPHFARTHDYVLVYTRAALETQLGIPKSTEEIEADFDESDERGVFRSLELRNTHRQFGKHNRPKLWFPIYADPVNGSVTLESTQRHKVEIWPVWDDGFEGCWTWGQAKVRGETYDLYAREVGGRWKVYRKARAVDQDGAVVKRKLKTMFVERSFHTEKGQQTFDELMEPGLFQAPKPVGLIQTLLRLGSPDDLVLDFFAGSGTTAQAMLELNLEDGGNRKFILVQLPEPTGREDFPTIAEITKERVRRVIRRIEKERVGQFELSSGAPAIDLGFRVFKLAPSNFSVWDPTLAPRQPDELAKQWQLTADNVRPDAHEQALLYELMLKCGLPLSSPVETVNVAGCTAYRLDEGRRVICLAREVTQEALRAMIALQPQSLLCLDIGFKGNDALKVNAQLECQSHGIQFRTA
jgi:adenine-specific DNA-methyltransferase